MKGVRNPRVADLIDSAIAAGWRTRVGSKHVIVYPPDGDRPITISKTANDKYHGYQNVRLSLKRKGLNV